MARTLRLKSYDSLATSVKLRLRGSNTVVETIALSHVIDGIYTGTITAAAEDYDIYVFIGATLVDHGTITIAATDPGVYEPDNLSGLQTFTGSVPAPSAPNLSVGALLTLDPQGIIEPGVIGTFRLLQGPGSPGYSLDSEPFSKTSDFNGIITAEFIRSAQYVVRRGTSGKEVRFTVPDSASFNIAEHLGKP